MVIGNIPEGMTLISSDLEIVEILAYLGYEGGLFTYLFVDCAEGDYTCVYGCDTLNTEDYAVKVL